jgi:MSHA biogenesis protein MshK
VFRWLLTFVVGLASTGALATAGELVDPTRPADVMPLMIGDVNGSGGTFELNSVLISPERRIAIVNGIRVKRGDQIDGAEVVEINPGVVRLKAEGETFEVRMTASVKTVVSGGGNPDP